MWNVLQYVWNIPEKDLPASLHRQGPVISKMWLKKIISQRLSDIYEQDWLGW